MADMDSRLFFSALSSKGRTNMGRKAQLLCSCEIKNSSVTHYAKIHKLWTPDKRYSTVCTEYVVLRIFNGVLRECSLLKMDKKSTIT